MKRNLLSLLLTAALAATAGLHAQSVTVTQLPTQHLLPTAPVHRLLQDDEGYMWYATEGGGLCRDNGYQIDIFRTPLAHAAPGSHVVGVDSLQSNTITCLAWEGRTHRVWFGTAQGLYYVDKRDYRVHAAPDDRLRHAYVRTLFAATDGTVWAAAGELIFRFAPGDTAAKVYPCRAHGRGLVVNCFHEDSRHTLRALCSEEALLLFDPEADRFRPLPWDAGTSPTSLVEDPRSGLFWVGTWGKGVLRYTPGASPATACQEATLPPGSTAYSREVLHLLLDHRQGLLWVATMDDLYAYRTDGGRLQAVSASPFLPQGKKVLDHPFEDRAGNIWVPGYTPHTFILSSGDDPVERYDVRATRRATGYPVMADAVVPEGAYYWIWQGRDNLTLYHPATDRIAYASHRQDPETGTPLRTEKCLEACRRQEGIWAADGARLLHVGHHGMDIRARERARLDSTQVITALHDDGTRLWIGTRNALYELSLLGNRLRKVADGTGWIRHLTVTPQGDVYAVAGGTGFIRISPSGKTTIIAPGDDYLALAQLPDGTVWTGTGQGDLYSYRPATGTLVLENARCLQHGEGIKDLASDEAGHVWILTEQYVKEFNPANNAFRIFRNQDCRIGMDYFHCVRRIDGNRVCIGGIGAFCVIPSSAELNRADEPALRPLVTAVTLGDSLLLPGLGQHTVTLCPEQENCTVTFSTLDHLHADKINYAYRLKGWEEAWTYLPQGSNTAYFGRLPKGTYQLELKATDRYGCWGAPHVGLTLHRQSAWYETGWAYLIYIAAAAVLAFGLTALFRRIRLLRELQQRRKEIVLDSVEIRADELPSARFEKEFLRKAAALVEQHLADGHYNVEQLSSDLCMSRMNLYRKLQMQTGQSPTEFIRSIRLKKAATLLADTSAPVGEIARRVGFSTPAYFSKCFKEMFGVLPGSYGGRQEQGTAPSTSDQGMQQM